MAKCNRCGTTIPMMSSLCKECAQAAEVEAASNLQNSGFTSTPTEGSGGQCTLSAAEAKVLLTTESVIDLPIAERLDVITAECVLGMNILKDILSAGRDFFGGRSKVTQRSLRDARVYALNELRREAASIGADAVVGIDLDYSEISGGSKSMLFLVASGTAVKLKNNF